MARKMEITTRPIGDGDRPFLRELYASTRREELAPTGWPQEQIEVFLSQQFHAQHVHYMQHYPKADFDLLLHEDTPIGRLYLEEWPSQFRIIDIALLPEWRGKGIGGGLLQKIIQRAAAAGKAVSIHVEKNNPAMTLYRRLGFQREEDKGVYDLLKLVPATAAGEDAA